MVTDPPYGVNYDPTWRMKGLKQHKIKSVGLIENDHRIDWTEAYSLFTGNIAYVWHSGKYSHIIAQNLIDCGYEIAYQIIWNKNSGAIGRGDIHWKHEPCLYAIKKGKPHNWQGSRDVWSVWDIQNLSARNVQLSEGQSGHGSQKPLECMARPIRNNSKEGDIIYDPFLGSGTTMIASEKLNRVCYGLELTPKYCQIIINRMHQLNTVLVIKINGKIYEP